jgi:hypothetical protein
MSGSLSELALQLDDLVRTVPGVATLFSANPALLRSARQLTAGGEVAMITVGSTDTGLTVVASIGVMADVQAPITARAVSDAIRVALAGWPGVSEIAVRVSRVAGPL